MIVDGAVRLWRCDRADVIVEDVPIADPDQALESRWRELLADNPRHFDGPILSVDEWDPERALVRTHADCYKRLAAQPQVDSGVVLLAATAALTAHDGAGCERLLMIRRHPDTRLYGGLWEIGPSGGVEPTGARSLAIDDVIDLLHKELLEEAGLSDPMVEPRVGCVYHDDQATSFDIVVRARLERPIEALAENAVQTHWDASETAWVALDELGAFVDREPCIPPTRAVLAALGLI